MIVHDSPCAKDLDIVVGKFPKIIPQYPRSSPHHSHIIRPVDVRPGAVATPPPPSWCSGGDSMDPRELGGADFGGVAKRRLWAQLLILFLEHVWNMFGTCLEHVSIVLIEFLWARPHLSWACMCLSADRARLTPSHQVFRTISISKSP